MTNPDDPEAQENQRIGEVIALGGEITGGLGSVALGFVLAGPAGAAAGAVASPVISRMVRGVGDFAYRHLSGRQKMRIGAVVRFAAADLEDQVAQGRPIRRDGFFDAQPGDRPPFDELAEAVMAAAEDAHEERKIVFLGTLMSEIALRPGIDRAAAITLTREVRGLTYRQILLLALFARSGDFDLRADTYLMPKPSDLDPVVPVLAEIADLGRRNLVALAGATFDGLYDIIPSAVELTGLGFWLFHLMRLRSVPTAELEPLASILAEPPSEAAKPA